MPTWRRVFVTFPKNLVSVETILVGLQTFLCGIPLYCLLKGTSPTTAAICWIAWALASLRMWAGLAWLHGNLEDSVWRPDSRLDPCTQTQRSTQLCKWLRINGDVVVERIHSGCWVQILRRHLCSPLAEYLHGWYLKGSPFLPSGFSRWLVQLAFICSQRWMRPGTDR